MERSKRIYSIMILTALAVVIARFPSVLLAQTDSNLDYQRPAFKFTELADDVYIAVPTETIPTWCNAAIIINDSDVIIVDTHLSPAAAQALLEELKSILNITMPP
ncbi:hypothetical protein ACFLT7_08345 [candidate division KSB1 bacterium]